MPDFDIEKSLGNKIVAGIDEVGYGALAGEVFACACIFKVFTPLESIKIDDSKKLSVKNRQKAYDALINSNNVEYKIASVSVDEIDNLNVLKASHLAMQKTIDSLEIVPDIILIDGNKNIDFYKNNKKIESFSIIKGDSKSYSIASASIIAKVTRDKLMDKIHEQYSKYNWLSNKGYGTKEHFDAINELGITKHHRKSFLKKYCNN